MAGTLLAVTCGSGDYRAYARMFAERWNDLNDVECRDLSNAAPWPLCRSKPGFVKAYVFDLVEDAIDRIMWIDADCYPAIRAPLDDLPDVPFAACLDHPAQLESLKQKRPEMCVLPKSFNSGVFVARRAECATIFRKLQKTRDSFGLRFEQGALNMLVHERLGSWVELGIEWNWRPALARILKSCSVPYIFHDAGKPGHKRLSGLYENSISPPWEK